MDCFFVNAFTHSVLQADTWDAFVIYLLFLDIDIDQLISSEIMININIKLSEGIACNNHTSYIQINYVILNELFVLSSRIQQNEIEES